MKLLHSDDELTFFHHKIDSPISYSAFFLYVTGTNQAGDHVTADQLGRVTFNARNEQLIDVDFDVLQALTDAIGGHAIATSANGAPFEFGAIIPRSFIDDNVEFMDKVDNAIFRMNMTVTSTQAVNMLVELYAVPDEGLNAYNLKIIQNSASYAGAGTFKEDQSDVENLAAVFLADKQGGTLQDITTNIDRIKYRIGDKDGDMSTGAALAATRAFGQIEAAAFVELGKIYSAEVGDLNGRLDDAIEITLDTNGASTPQFLMLGMNFNPNKVVETAQRLENRFSGIVARKTAQGRARSVTTLRQLAVIGKR